LLGLALLWDDYCAWDDARRSTDRS
jgi:hypothetical protein